MNDNSQESQMEFLTKEVQQLRQMVDQLQADQKQIKVQQDEMCACVKDLSKPWKPSFSLEQLEQWARDFEQWVKEPPSDGLPLSAFIGELEELAKGNSGGK